MAKPLTNREMELFRLALHYYIQYDKCCPDVGMGPTRHTMCQDLAKKLSFKIDEDDIAEMCEVIRGS